MKWKYLFLINPKPLISGEPSKHVVEYRDIDQQYGKIFHDGYTYHRCGMQRNNSIYYRCSQRRKYDCRASLQTKPNGIINTANGHNHPVEMQNINEGPLKRTKIIYDGYAFYRHVRTANKIHWRCIKYNLLQCTVRLHTDTNGKIQNIRGTHNHERDATTSKWMNNNFQTIQLTSIADKRNEKNGKWRCGCAWQKKENEITK